MINIYEYLLNKKNPKLNGIVEATNNNIRQLVWDAIKENGIDADLNFIDTSKVTNMSSLFEYSDFCGDISMWDVSEVTDMDSMFYGAKMFNCDISGWDVRNVIVFENMFHSAEVFNKPIGCWKTESAVKMRKMFYCAKKFDQDLSNWTVNKVNDNGLMFSGSGMSQRKEYWPKFLD